MPEQPKAHYVAHLKIEAVERRATPSITGETKRNVVEVAQITLKGDTLDKLIEKLGKHIEIIEED